MYLPGSAATARLRLPSRWHKSTAARTSLVMLSTVEMLLDLSGCKCHDGQRANSHLLLMLLRMLLMQ